MSRIPLSPNHGLNPSIAQCYFCGEDTGEIILAGRMKGADQEAPRHAVWHKNPCPKCQEYMKQGVILIGCLNEPKPGKEPERSGHFLVVTDDWIKRMIQSQTLQEHILKARVAFVPKELAQQLHNEAKQLEKAATDGKPTEPEPTTEQG